MMLLSLPSPPVPVGYLICYIYLALFYIAYRFVHGLTNATFSFASHPRKL